MQVGLKIWRYDASTGDRALREYEVDVPEEATLLDTLDVLKDRVDGSLAYRKSCRMMICGSCGMRVDGGAVLACKTRIADITTDGRVPVISAMGNLPIVKDLVVDMDPFWQKMRAVQPYLTPRYDQPDERENVVSQPRMDVIHKESLCINCGCCVSECNSMESDPDFLGPAALAKGFRFVGDPRDGATVERLDRYSEEHGIWDCTRCYFCNERCPKGVDPRDAIAKLGAEAMRHGIDHDMGARHAKWFVVSAKTTGWLRETELVPKTQGVVKAIKEIKFAMSLLPKGKVPPPFPPHVAAEVEESRELFDLVKTQGRDGALGIVQGEKALGRLEHGHGTANGHGDRHPYGEGSFAKPYLPGQTPEDDPNVVALLQTAPSGRAQVSDTGAARLLESVSDTARAHTDEPVSDTGREESTAS
jgi:succinate dehydrogenase / fumarate reductase iron-sulfur subunit